MDNLTAYILIGRSGSGKGTQAKALIDYLTQTNSQISSKAENILYAETGQYFRDFILGEGYSNCLSKNLMTKSKPQPAFMAIWIWARVLVDKLKENDHVIFDGTPRSLVEAEALDTALNFYNFKRRVVIYLDVSRQWSERKLLSRGRSDDNVDDIKARLDWFDRDVSPVVAFYKNATNYHYLTINGEQSIESVQAEIRKGLMEE